MRKNGFRDSTISHGTLHSDGQQLSCTLLSREVRDSLMGGGQAGLPTERFIIIYLGVGKSGAWVRDDPKP